VAHCLAAINGSLDQESISWSDKSSLGVVLAAGGYPGPYENGHVIRGLDTVTQNDEMKIFHAGTRLQGNDVVTAGGRVLCATALGNTVTEAQQNAYALASQIHWKDMNLRTDIGYRAIARELNTPAD
jgi:phosphoribosylamine--glycine ligase